MTKYPLQVRVKARAIWLWWKVPMAARRPLERVWAFLFRGARRVLMGPTSGRVQGDGIFIEFGGMCPVQGDGQVMGREAYYRSRGTGWELCIAREDSTDPLADDAWVYFEDRYFWPDGGYVDASVSVACIERAVKAWREAGHP